MNLTKGEIKKLKRKKCKICGKKMWDEEAGNISYDGTICYNPCYKKIADIIKGKIKLVKRTGRDDEKIEKLLEYLQTKKIVYSRKK